MGTWHSGHNCTDCGREINRPGTCADCMITNQPVPEKLIKDLKDSKQRKEGKRK